MVQVGTDTLPYEWRTEPFDAALWEDSKLPTGWWLYHLYRRISTKEPATGPGRRKRKTKGKKPPDSSQDPQDDVAPTEGGDAEQPAPEEEPGAPAAPQDRLSEREKAQLAQRWKLDPDGEVFHIAMQSDKNMAFVEGLKADQRASLTWAHLRDSRIPSPKEIAKDKKARAEQERKERNRAKDAKNAEKKAAKKKAADTKREDAKKAFVTALVDVEQRARDRVDAQLPGYQWHGKFQEITKPFEDKIDKHPEINIEKQVEQAEGALTAVLDLEKKRRDIAEAAKDYPNLRHDKLRDAQDGALQDQKLSIEDAVEEFRALADAALDRQRNPEDVDKWVGMLNLRFYREGASKPSLRLTAQDGLAAHATVKSDSLTRPTVNPKTTATELLDELFGGVDQIKRLHVSLETGTQAGPDDLRLPHRYWNGSRRALYALKFTDEDGRQQERWKDPHTKVRIRNALDAAYQELSNVLIARAQAVLDKDCLAQYD